MKDKSTGARIVITMGDPDGIGPGILLRSLVRRTDWQRFVVIGDRQKLCDEASRLKINLPFTDLDYEGAHYDANSIGLIRPVVSTGMKTHDVDTLMMVEALRLAVSICLNKNAAGMVTGPIAKHRIAKVLPDFRGHTEYLAAASGCTSVMMLKSPDLAVVPLTGHIPLASVASALDSDDIFARIVMVDHAFRRQFGIKSPRLALAGLNPHAGDDGLIGREEIEILAPVVSRCRSRGIAIEGPLSADTVFTPDFRKQFDCILCPSHDQALIPIKALYFDDAVNVTLGLPFVRTSPDHGPAYPAARSGVFKHRSMAAAIELAVDLVDRST